MFLKKDKQRREDDGQLMGAPIFPRLERPSILYATTYNPLVLFLAPNTYLQRKLKYEWVLPLPTPWRKLTASTVRC